MGARSARRNLSSALARWLGIGRSLCGGRHGLLEQGQSRDDRDRRAALRRLPLEPEQGPWADAKRRGATFRALGNEPAWYVEIFADRLVSSRSSARSGPSSSMAGAIVEGRRTTYRAAADGFEATVVIDRRACADSMSGEGLKRPQPSASRIERCSAAAGFCERSLAPSFAVTLAREREALRRGDFAQPFENRGVEPRRVGAALAFCSAMYSLRDAASSPICRSRSWRRSAFRGRRPRARRAGAPASRPAARWPESRRALCRIPRRRRGPSRRDRARRLWRRCGSPRRTGSSPPRCCLARPGSRGRARRRRRTRCKWN